MTRKTTIILIALLTAGCQSVDGTYRPGCVAYEGNEISLSSGRFVWDRFTDQVTVDAGGEVVDPFPDYPRRGSFTVDGSRLELSFADASPARLLFVVEEQGRLRLLTAGERTVYERTGRVPDCALARDAAAGT